MGGLRHLTGEPGRVPVRVGVSIGETLAALHGTIGKGAELTEFAQRKPRPENTLRNSVNSFALR